ncbi:MAG TPA: hypothetical protein VJX67_01400 [Blastocatellia bacterium]|nr:hypothetical protein [Blastocatellia bacterium]
MTTGAAAHGQTAAMIGPSGLLPGTERVPISNAFRGHTYGVLVGVAGAGFALSELEPARLISFCVARRHEAFARLGGRLSACSGGREPQMVAARWRGGDLYAKACLLSRTQHGSPLLNPGLTFRTESRDLRLWPQQVIPQAAY